MEEADLDRRTALYLAVFGAAGLPLLQAGAAAAEPAAPFPERGWAHRDKLVDLTARGALRGPGQLFDYLLIQEAFARYGMAYDEARIDVLTELFTADAVVELGRGSGKPFATLTGRDDIVANFSKALGTQRDQRRHFMTNLMVDRLTPAEAKAVAYEVVTIADHGLKLGATVVCAASLRKVAGHWRFARMFIGMDDYI
jgi:hypothetical protein